MEQTNKKKQTESSEDNEAGKSSEQSLTSGRDENVIAAHEQAEEDIEQDPEFSAHSPNDDLDEAETARLGDDETDLV